MRGQTTPLWDHLKRSYTMFSLLGSLFSIIPGLTSLGQSWVTASYNAQVQEYTTRLNVNRDQAMAILAMQQAVQTKWWFVAIMPPLFALPYVIYTWKAVVWDNVVLGGAGNTPALGGILSTLFLMIVTFYFAKGFSGR